MDKWNDRIRLARVAVKLKKGQLAELCEVTPATITGWENHSIKKIDGENLVRAAKALNKTPEWIMTGEGESVSGSEAARFAAETAWVYRHADENGRTFLETAVQTVKTTYSQPLRMVKKKK